VNLDACTRKIVCRHPETKDVESISNSNVFGENPNAYEDSDVILGDCCGSPKIAGVPNNKFYYMTKSRISVTVSI